MGIEQIRPGRNPSGYLPRAPFRATMSVLTRFYGLSWPLHDAWKERCDATSCPTDVIMYKYNQAPRPFRVESMKLAHKTLTARQPVLNFRKKKGSARPPAPKPPPAAPPAAPPVPRPPKELKIAIPNASEEGRGCRKRTPPAWQTAAAAIDEIEELPPTPTPRSSSTRKRTHREAAAVPAVQDCAQDEDWDPSPSSARGSSEKKRAKRARSGWSPEEVQQGMKRERSHPSRSNSASPRDKLSATMQNMPIIAGECKGDVRIAVILAQGQEQTEDAEYTARIRSNGRSAKMTISLTCPDRKMADHIRALLKNSPVAGSCTLSFCLRYADSHQQIAMKQRGQTPNWISLMAPGDNVKNATKYMRSQFEVGSQKALSAGEVHPAWQHLEVMECNENDPCTVWVDAMIVTNITSFVHDYRNFEWAVLLSYTPDDQTAAASSQGATGPLEYYAKPKTQAELAAMENHKLERMAERAQRLRQQKAAPTQTESDATTTVRFSEPLLEAANASTTLHKSASTQSLISEPVANTPGEEQPDRFPTSSLPHADSAIKVPTSTAGSARGGAVGRMLERDSQDAGVMLKENKMPVDHVGTPSKEMPPELSSRPVLSPVKSINWAM